MDLPELGIRRIARLWPGTIYADRGGNEPAVASRPKGQRRREQDAFEMEDRQNAGRLRPRPSSAAIIFIGSRAKGVLECRRIETGEKLFPGRLEGLSKVASPIATADGRVYFVSTGKSYVIKAGPRARDLGATNDLAAAATVHRPRWLSRPDLLHARF